MHSRRLIYLTPVLGFLVIAGAILWGLKSELDPRVIPPVLIADPVPEFVLPALQGAGVPGFSSADLSSGEVALVNVFASWCFPCRAEHPFLIRLAREWAVPIYGINYQDKRADAVRWLVELGNPYAAIGADENGRVSANWGVSGLPETFIIDGAGVIRYRHLGPLFPEVLQRDILPLIRSLREART